MYLFKHPAGYFVMGDNKNSISRSGLFKLLYNLDTETILIIDNSIIQTPDWTKSISPTTIKKLDGTYYKTCQELIDALQGFFSEKSGIGADLYTRYNVPIDLVDGRSIFEVPDVIDLTKDTIAIEGKFTHSPELDYTVDNEGYGNVGRFIFNTAPTEQLVLRYIKG